MNLLDEVINRYRQRVSQQADRPVRPLPDRKVVGPVTAPPAPADDRGSLIASRMAANNPPAPVTAPTPDTTLPFGLYIPTAQHGNISDFGPYLKNPDDFGAYFSQALDRVGGTISQDMINEYAKKPLNAIYDFRIAGRHNNNGPTDEERAAAIAEHQASKAARLAATPELIPTNNGRREDLEPSSVSTTPQVDMSPTEQPNLLNVVKFNLANNPYRRSTSNRPSLQHRSFSKPSMSFGGTRNAF